MGLFKREKRALSPKIDPYQITGRPAGVNLSGEFVDDDTALGMSSVMACVGLLADSVASLPLRTFRLIDGRKIELPLPPFMKGK